MKDREKKIASEYVFLLLLIEFVDIVDDMIREIHQRGRGAAKKRINISTQQFFSYIILFESNG